MTCFLRRALIGRLSLLVVLGLIAALPSTSLAGDAEEGFIPLFDGQTLDGWHKNPEPIGHGTGGQWTVEDGAITGQQDPPGSGNGGILLTDRKFGDCELLIDIKPDWGVCSGLFVRSNDKGQCFQMMVDYHEEGNVGHIYGEGTGGFNNRPFDIFGVYDASQALTALTGRAKEGITLPAAYSIAPDAWVAAWKVNDWNAVRVRVVGNPPHIATWINGVKVSEFDGQTFDGPGYDKTGVAETLTAEGSIAVQVHGGKSWPEGAKCRWKNVRVKPL
jgi:hypothetical protein